ncbi:glutathione S-transferase family protein [Pseudomonas sp. FP597]|uniref:glutathione S-transferase family protein n=1 Tax=Pseudomonas sp. FP597 TaxID=2954096 RepID=UPI00273556E8|nr:glutathione S-transferase family protein [Pseudomonas sp. FP597]WLI05914.1 glutathione S-transferase family protein [Pseudomonas sp. FP597]
MSEVRELYGASTGNSLRAAIALAEAGIEFTPRCLDLLSGDQRAPEYLALNPLGKAPTFVDHSVSPTLVINQSNAIMQYADEQAPGRLSPIEPSAQRYRVYDRFYFFVTDVIAPSHAAFFLRQIGQQDASAPLNRRALEHLMTADAFLESGYIAGDAFSMADISAFTFARSVRDQIDLEKLPRMARWLALIEARPAVKLGMQAFESKPSSRK